MGLNKLNALSCERTLNEYQYENFREAIQNEFMFKLYMDGLPAAVIERDHETGEVHKNYYDGIPVGKITDTQQILYNHWEITVRVQPLPETVHMRIVGFEVEPRSYARGSTPEMEFKPHKVLDLMEVADKLGDPAS